MGAKALFCFIETLTNAVGGSAGQACRKNSVGVRLQSLLAKSLSAGNYGTCFYGKPAPRCPRRRLLRDVPAKARTNHRDALAFPLITETKFSMSNTSIQGEFGVRHSRASAAARFGKEPAVRGERLSFQINGYTIDYGSRFGKESGKIS
jgi:hypothetical protein